MSKGKEDPMKVQLTKRQKINLVEVGLKVVKNNPEEFAKFCEDYENEQRRITMSKNSKNKRAIEANNNMQGLINRTREQIKEINLFYGVLKHTQDLKASKENEIHKLITSVKSDLLNKHNLPEEEIDLINWDVDPEITTNYKDWCKEKDLDMHRYETITKYLNQ